jgi:predicted RNA-binding Zn ribbon-like protein
MNPEKRKYTFIGDDLALDFVNTISNRQPEPPYDFEQEYLVDYAELVNFGEQSGIVSAGEAEKLLREAENKPEQAQKVLEQAVILREALYRLLIKRLKAFPQDQADLEIMNSAIAKAMPHLQMQINENDFSLGWEQSNNLGKIVWEIVQSGIDLLTSEKLKKLGQCKGKECGWLFLDTSKNRQRQWCSMQDCGNRAKAQRHYQRKKAQF